MAIGVLNVRVAPRDLEATKHPSPEATRVGQATSSSPSSSSVSLLGIDGLRVLDVFEFADERHVFVETVRDHDACRQCGQRAVSGGRHPVQVRDLPVGAKATRLIWHKREWRCRDCGHSWREQGIPTSRQRQCSPNVPIPKQPGRSESSAGRSWRSPASSGSGGRR